MNLDELKTMWQQQEQGLAATQKTNEQMLRTMLLHRSQDATGRILNVEYASVVLAALILLVLLCCVSLLPTNAWMTAAYAVSVLLTSIGVGWGGYKIRFLHRLRFGAMPVAHLAEGIERFRLMVVKEKICSIILLPVILGSLLPLARQLVYGDGALVHLQDYLIRVALGTLAGAGVALLLYHKYYTRNIESIQQHLEEIRAFRQ